MAKLPGAYELMATAASPAINFGRGLLGYQDPFITQTMQDRMAELEAGRTKGNIGYEDYGLQTATPGGRFTGGLMDLALNNPVDFGLAGSIGRYSFSPQGRTGLNYDFTPDQDTGSTGNAILDFINRGGLKNAISGIGTAQASEINPQSESLPQPKEAIYQDKIMGGVRGDPNPFGYQNQINDFVIDNEDYQEIPGFNFRDAPTSLMSRIQNPQFLNNPRTGFIDNTLMQRGNPGNSIIDKARSGIGKGFNLGKSAIGGIASLIARVPGIGALLGMLPERDYRQNTIDNFYSDPSTRGLMSQIPGMDQYNTVSGGLLNMLTGGWVKKLTYGLSGAIDKRMATIQKTLGKQGKKKSAVLEQRLKDLQELKTREAKALADAKAKQTSSFDPSGPTQASIRSSREDRSGKGQSGGFTNPGKGSYGPFS
jgi:hypothetical protein